MATTKLKVDRFGQLEERLGVEFSGVTASASRTEYSFSANICGELIGRKNDLDSDLRIVATVSNKDRDVIGTSAEAVEAHRFVGIEAFAFEIFLSRSHGDPQRVRLHVTPTK
jgi:hypothetical protein